jgi:hypothetical protein
MWRISSSSIFAVVLLLAPLPARGQSLPSKKDAADLLVDLAKKENLTASGNPSFHLMAKLHYEVIGHPMDGEYELLWADPSRYREEFRLGGLSETDLALGDKLYTLRNTPVLTWVQSETRSLMRLVAPKTMVAEAQMSNHLIQPSTEITEPPRVAKVYTSSSSGQELICLDVHEELTVTTTCVDPLTRKPVSAITSGGYRDVDTSLTKDRFYNLADGNYPGRIVFSFVTETLEVDVTKLEPVAQFADVVFAPPAGVTPHDWCANPDGPKHPGYMAPDDGFDNLLPDQILGYYLRVGRNGHAESVYVINEGGGFHEGRNSPLTQGRFPVYSCAGKPIEYETDLLVARINGMR